MPTDELLPINDDPPPPYPVNSRTRRVRASRRAGQHVQLSSSDSQCGDYDTFTHASGSGRPLTVFTADGEPSETTPFLSSSPQVHVLRPRSLSHGSIMSSVSAAPSLAQTLTSIFYVDDEGDGDAELLHEHSSSPSAENGIGHSRRRWKAYWRPAGKLAYWKSLFHLAVLNFPYALAAWIYLFVFTVTGTTLLILLPLGAILCFFNLFGARSFARGELSLQTRFHHPFVYPRHPLFSRLREASASEIEAGSNTHGELVPETSFYKNTYTMVTDPLSYQALFYFLVVKPAITLILFLLLVIVGIPLFVLVLPIPVVLRMARKLGIWQAGIAVEGLAFAVR